MAAGCLARPIWARPSWFPYTCHLRKHYSKPPANITLCICAKLSLEILICRTGFPFLEIVGRCGDWVRLCWPRDGQLRSHTYTKSILESLASEWCKFYRSLCTMWLAISALTGTCVITWHTLAQVHLPFVAHYTPRDGLLRCNIYMGSLHSWPLNGTVFTSPWAS